VNWNILVTLGKEIKRDSIISVNENRFIIVIMFIITINYIIIYKDNIKPFIYNTSIYKYIYKYNFIYGQDIC